MNILIDATEAAKFLEVSPFILRELIKRDTLKPATVAGGEKRKVMKFTLEELKRVKAELKAEKHAKAEKRVKPEPTTNGFNAGYQQLHGIVLSQSKILKAIQADMEALVNLLQK